MKKYGVSYTTPIFGSFLYRVPSYILHLYSDTLPNYINEKNLSNKSVIVSICNKPIWHPRLQISYRYIDSQTKDILRHANAEELQSFLSVMLYREETWAFFSQGTSFSLFCSSRSHSSICSCLPSALSSQWIYDKFHRVRLSSHFKILSLT